MKREAIRGIKRRTKKGNESGGDVIILSLNTKRINYVVTGDGFISKVGKFYC